MNNPQRPHHLVPPMYGCRCFSLLTFLANEALRVPEHPRGRGAVHLQPFRGVHCLPRLARGHPGRDDLPPGALGPLTGGAEAKPFHALLGGCGVALAQGQRGAGLARRGRRPDPVSGKTCHPLVYRCCTKRIRKHAK